MKISNLLRTVLAVVLIASTAAYGDAATRKSKSRTRAKTGMVIKQGETHSYADGALTTQDFSFNQGKFSFKIEYPIGGDENLVKNIRECIQQFMAPDYTGSLATPDGLIKKALTDNKRDGVIEFDDKISVTYSNGKIITLNLKYYFYAGGAHGGAVDISSTFAIKGAKPLTPAMLPSISKMRPLLLQALAKDGFEDVCLGNTNELDYGIPFIMADGLHFIYGQYEIGPYFWGMPEVTLPLSQIRGMLSESVINEYF